MNVELSGQVCGASITGVDLTQPLSAQAVANIRELWLEHHVLCFPGQSLSDDDLERFSLYFGPFGDDPFIAPIAGREHVIEIRRNADEKAPLFAESWHSDWSFQDTPPAGTCLYGLVIPPHGGDTLFADQHAALAGMPSDLRARLEKLNAIHSARGGYAPDGLYGESDRKSDRSMDIRPSSDALSTRTHPVISPHPETGEPRIFGCGGYIIGFEGMSAEAGHALLLELLAHQTQDAFVYRHRWQAGMLVMWDNRSVLHRATGGYEGFDRVLHRTTIAAQ